MPQQTIRKEPEQENSDQNSPQQKTLSQSGAAVSPGGASLVEALQSLVSDLAKASSEADVEEGLQRLKQIRSVFLGSPDSGSANAARRNTEALIAWVETRLQQLRQQLVRKRQILESEAIQKIAKQREADTPSLIPTELIDAVIRFTTDAEKENSPKETEVPAPLAESEPSSKGAASKERAEKDRMDRVPETLRQAPTAFAEQSPAASQKALPKSGENRSAAAQKAPTASAENRPVPHRAEASRPVPPHVRDWNRAERLAAHLAACVKEDSKYFEKLRGLVRRGARLQPPADLQKAEAHYRAVHDLSKRLVNLEMHAKAIARGEQPVSPLLRTAAREIKGFLQDLKASREKQPEMAEEYDRLFGGYAQQLTAIKPEKGGDILARCRKELQPQPQALPERQQPPQPAEPEAPQLVLKRPDDWQQ